MPTFSLLFSGIILDLDDFTRKLEHYKPASALIIKIVKLSVFFLTSFRRFELFGVESLSTTQSVLWLYGGGEDNMDKLDQILRKLRWLLWLNAFLAICFAGSVGSLLWVGSEINRPPFIKQSRFLLDDGRSTEVVMLTEEREKTYPTDPYVYWFRGKAYYQLGKYEFALKAILRAHELCPGWREQFTGPFIKIIKEKLAEKS